MGINSSRPIIGITCYVEEAVRGVWESMPHALLPYNYVTKVERAGGIAVLIPPRVDADAEMARAARSRTRACKRLVQTATPSSWPWRQSRDSGTPLCWVSAAACR
jgi:Peptidase C26